MREEARPDGLRSEQKPGSRWSLSLLCANKSQPAAESLHRSPNHTAQLHLELLPPRAAPSCPTCQGWAKDNLSWRTPVFWNLRQLLCLPADLYWEACWEQIHIYRDLALHFSEAEMSCNTIQHSLKCCLRLPQLEGSITSPTILVIRTMDIIIPCAGSGVCEWEKASHKFYWLDRLFDCLLKTSLNLEHQSCSHSYLSGFAFLQMRIYHLHWWQMDDSPLSHGVSLFALFPTCFQQWQRMLCLLKYTSDTWFFRCILEFKKKNKENQNVGSKQTSWGLLPAQVLHRAIPAPPRNSKLWKKRPFITWNPDFFHWKSERTFSLEVLIRWVVFFLTLLSEIMNSLFTLS